MNGPTESIFRKGFGELETLPVARLNDAIRLAARKTRPLGDDKVEKNRRTAQDLIQTTRMEQQKGWATQDLSWLDQAARMHFVVQVGETDALGWALVLALTQKIDSIGSLTPVVFDGPKSVSFQVAEMLTAELKSPAFTFAKPGQTLSAKAWGDARSEELGLLGSAGGSHVKKALDQAGFAPESHLVIHFSTLRSPSLLGLLPADATRREGQEPFYVPDIFADKTGKRAVQWLFSGSMDETSLAINRRLGTAALELEKDLRSSGLTVISNHMIPFGFMDYAATDPRDMRYGYQGGLSASGSVPWEVLSDAVAERWQEKARDAFLHMVPVMRHVHLPYLPGETLRFRLFEQVRKKLGMPPVSVPILALRILATTGDFLRKTLRIRGGKEGSVHAQVNYAESDLSVDEKLLKLVPKQWIAAATEAVR